LIALRLVKEERPADILASDFGPDSQVLSPGLHRDIQQHRAWRQLRNRPAFCHPGRRDGR
jgi:hypothetical protein